MNDTEGTQNTEAEAGSGIDPVIEAEAVSNNWVPKDQYRGDPADWLDAAEFVRKGRQINPILRKNNERLQRDLDSAKAELKELQLTTKEFAAEFSKMKDNAYNRALADLKAQKKEALQESDLVTAEEISERIEELKEARPKAQETKAEAKTPDLTVFREWHRENSWYDETKEPDLFDAAEAIALRLSRSEHGLTERAFMDKVGEMVKAKFPDKFENPRRKSGMHEGGGGRGETKRGKSFADLPPDGKEACKSYVKAGLMTEKQYLDAYEWE